MAQARGARQHAPEVAVVDCGPVLILFPADDEREVEAGEARAAEDGGEVGVFGAGGGVLEDAAVEPGVKLVGVEDELGDVVGCAGAGGGGS